MDMEKILLRINESKQLDSLKKFKQHKIIEIFDKYEDDYIDSISDYEILKIKNEYVLNECKKYNISKYATNTVEFYKIKGYNDEEIKSLLHKRNSSHDNSPYKKETYLKQGYSEKEAEFLVKSKRPINKEYWMNKGFSEKDAIEKVKEIQTENSYKHVKKAKEHPENYIGILPNQIEYWIKCGFSEEDAKKQVSERQKTFTLEKCIQKHGKELGELIWKNRQNKWKKKLQKHFNECGDGRSTQSKWANECIEYICDKLNIQKSKKEKFIEDKDTKKCYSYDFCYKHKIIEFNGDYWHCNPLFWKADSFNSTIKLYASEKWQKDEEKIKIAKKYNYDILVIWEYDFYNDKDKYLETCLNFITNEN